MSYISKLTERAVADQITEDMSKNNLHSPLQLVYKNCHSAETALLKVINDILLAMNDQQVSLLVLLDLSTAFDTVNMANSLAA